MQKNFTLVSTYLKNTKNKQHAAMPADELEPSQTSIQNILNYSRSLSIKTSNYIGFIEVLAS